MLDVVIHKDISYLATRENPGRPATAKAAGK
jgi:hypothetical protein